MRPIGILLFWAFVGVSALAISGPGTVDLDNTLLRGGSEEGRFFDEDGVLLSGQAYLAQLYAGTESDQLIKVGEPTGFLTNEMSGYFGGGTVTIPFIQGGLMAWVQVRAWEAAGGTSFEAAALSGHWTGISSILHVMTGNPSLGGVPTPPALLIGLKYPGNPVIVQEPGDHKIRAGQAATVGVIASGGIRLRYQWYQGESGNSVSLIKDATNMVYTAAPTMTSMYWVQAYTSAGSTNSATATVTVIPTNAVALDLRVDGRVPVLTIDTPTTGQLQVQFSETVGSPNWDTLTNISLTTNRLTIVDAGGSNALIRFYRGVILP